MPPLEYYGVFLAAQICRTHNNNIEKRIGRPCAIMRRGVKDLGLWRADRVLDYAVSGKRSQGPANPPTFYQGWKESSRLVGISEPVLRRIIGNAQPPAVLIPDMASEPHPLWPEQWLMSIRRMISSGEIQVRASSLTKPRFGVKVVSPRHRWTENQSGEDERLRKANPLDFVIW